MNARRFESAEELETQATALLATHLQWPSPEPYGVMLAGGKTPLPVYRRLTEHPVSVSPSVYVFHGDERMTPVESPESNYGNTAPMIHALGIPPERVLRVHTDLSPARAAARFDRDLAQFLKGGGRIGLGLLGLGQDGHTASLFRQEDTERGKGHWAMAVTRRGGLDRVTVTRDLLLKIGLIVFLVTGREKTDTVEAFLRAPLDFPAGRAVVDACNVEVWVA